MGYFKNKINIFILLGISIFSMSGCSATGMKFKEIKHPNQNDALVYFYRPDTFVGGGIPFNVMHIDTNSTETGFDSVIEYWKLRNNSYTEVYLKPGKYALSTNWMYKPKEYSFNANKVYCIKMNVTFASSQFSKHPSLLLVDPAVCKKELQGTRKMTKEDQESVMY